MINTVMTVGTFDILHVDHLNLFQQCRKLAGESGRVIVGVNSDSFVEEYKGIAPVMSELDRMLLVGAIRHVDEVFSNDDASLEWCMDAYGPDYLAIGSDWFKPGKDYLAQIDLTWQQMVNYDCMIVVVPSPEKVHSSQFKKPQGEPVLIGQKVVLTDEGVDDV